MGKTIGIDLGTTNSCMAVLEGGEPTVIENQKVDVVVAVAGARVGGRPMLKRGRRGVLDDVPWLRPLLTTPTVAIYATPSLAEGAKSCYKAT